MKENFTDGILLKQGVPQRDIMSPYIFIISFKILFIKINYTNDVKGTIFTKSKSRSETFAEDTSLIMERKDNYLCNMMKYLTKFTQISELKCNIGKTKVILIGDFYRDNKLCADINLDGEEDFTFLGFYIDSRHDKLDKNLWRNDQHVIELINKWKPYQLSVTIAMSILISQKA